MERLSGKDLNRRALENFIKAGAMDSLPGNRKQKILIVPDLLEKKSSKKNTVAGQMTLFDFASEEDKESFRIAFPKTDEFAREDLLAFEKETLGIYLSGHPLDSYTELWQQNVSARSTDFLTDPETGSARVRDGARVTIGGLITERTLKTTRTNQTMAFVTIEDLVGSVETLVFPRDFEKYRDQLVPDAKIFMQGRVSLGDGDDAGKLKVSKDTQQMIDMARKLNNTEILRILLRDSQSHPGKDRSFHYLPYRTDSLFEQTFLDEALKLQEMDSLGLEVYYNGDRAMTEFKIRCFKRAERGWQYVGMYTPDFLIIQRREGRIHKAIIVETKGGIYASDPTFTDKRAFMETEFLRGNNAAFGYERFEYLYLEDTLSESERINTVHQKITTFFQ